MTAVHVIGAGLAGLSAAVTLARAGRQVTVWEATPRAGGRCRSWFDPAAGAVIDNGTHLALSGNESLRRYLTMIGAEDRMMTVEPAALPFLDLATGARWTLRPGAAMVLRADARPPGVSGLTLLRDAARLMRADAAATVAQALGESAAFAALWAPLTVSALNMSPQQAAAALLAAVARETLLRGEAACRPMLPRVSLDDALISPAIAALAAAGGVLRPSSRVMGLTVENEKVTALAGVGAALAPGDQVVLATPAWVTAELLPGLPSMPPPGPAIVNAHFRSDASLPPMLGLVGGRTDWLFQRQGVLSATISAADDFAALPADVIAAQIWREAARAAGTDAPLPPYRVVKERMATISSAPADQGGRTTGGARVSNLFFAGDWTAAGLPSAMEGAIRSGFAAADACLSA